jgi:hypothetical protein
MGGYKKPKAQLHREFVYLNHDTVLNALSAFEAGKVDEIIEKTSEASEGGLDASLRAGPIKGGGAKKKTSNMQEELVRSRTWFSAFDAWHSHLEVAEAFGTLSAWDKETRDELGVGDTVRFAADVVIAPLHQVFATFIAFANDAGQADSAFGAIAMKPQEIAELKKTARSMAGWMRGRSDEKNILAYLRPFGIAEPRIVVQLNERYVVGGVGGLEGRFTVIGQVESLLADGEVVPAVRIVRDVPPTPMETQAITAALEHLVGPAREMGVDIGPDDLVIPHPAAIVRPIAIYR